MGKGFLVAVGGNISKYQNEIYKAFLEKAGGEKAKLAIFVVSSEIPIESFVSVQNAFINLGVEEKNIQVVPLTYLPQLIKNGWYKSGNNAELLTYLNEITGVWFVGGNQMRISKALMNDYKTDTIVLKAIRNFHNKGGVVGGTSAGASILGNPMIGGGSDIGALTLPIYYDEDDYENRDLNNIGQVLATQGFGLFEYGLIDQHFNTRPRLQRVLKVMEAMNIRRSIGIDEDTAIVCNCEDGSCNVIGAGKATLITRENDLINIVHHKSGNSFKLNKK